MEIYRIKDYNESRENIDNTFDIDQITSYLSKNKYKSLTDDVAEIENDNSYHQIFYDRPDKYYTLFCDLDKIDDEETPTFYGTITGLSKIKDICEDISDSLNIDIDLIKYTVSEKEKGVISSHISIPQFNASLSIIKTIFEEIKNKSIWGKHIDLCVYKDYQLYRLPNQTNEQKKDKHIIKHGKLIDFLNYYIPDDSIRITENDIKKTEVKKSKKQRQDDVLINKILNKISDEDIINLLDELNNNDSSYVEDYDKWLIITGIMKNINKFDIWNEWSKNSDRYNEIGNKKIWNSLKKFDMDLRYIYKVLNKKIDINYYKEYKPIEKEYTLVKTKTICNYRLYDEEQTMDKIYNYNNLVNNDTIIIKSCTGTGKTTGNAKLIRKYMNEKPHIKLLTIISRVSLGHQIVSAFKHQDIDLKNYKHNKFRVGQNYNVCLNSINKIKYMSDACLKNYVVYIDEINSFIKHITHNITIHKDLKEICTILFRIIKNAHKVIVSDAVISDGVFTFLNSRIKDDTHTLYINNTFQKYKDVKAYQCLTESDFKNKIEENIKNNDYFLFGCDSCTLVESLYYDMIYKYDDTLTDDDRKLLEQIKEKAKEKATSLNPDDIEIPTLELLHLKRNRPESKFRLYTSNIDFEIIDASEEFKDKYVFYSPSIETGIDFTIDKKQDVFIYISGRTIDASGSFQQLSRTRNIRDVYYYCNFDDQLNQYEKLQDVDELYTTLLKGNQIINDMCVYIDEDDNIVVSKNTFYKCFIYNEYVQDIYYTSRLKHFQHILEINGFNMLVYKNDNTEKVDFDTTEKNILKTIRSVINESLFTKYLETDEEDQEFNEEYNEINDLITLFNLPKDKDILMKYKSIFVDEYFRSKHFDIMRFFKNDNYIHNKIQEVENTSNSVKCYNDVYHKIKLLRKIQKDNNLSILNLNKYGDGIFKCDDWKYITKIFNSEKKQPATIKEFKDTHISFIKNIIGHDLIDNNKKQVSGVRTRIYEFNISSLTYHIELNKYTTKDDYSTFSKEFLILLSKDLIKKQDTLYNQFNILEKEIESESFKYIYVKNRELEKHYDTDIIYFMKFN